MGVHYPGVRVTFDPFRQPLQLFTGKGGVGKSTVVAAIARRAAQRGLRPLLVEMGHRASMETVLGGGNIGYEPQSIAGVSAMNLDFDQALEDYVAENFRSRRLAGAVLGNSAVARFVRAAPAVAEVATLSKLRALVASDEYHPIYVDLDATGHALMLLELPRVLDGLVGRGPLRRLLAALSTLLGDPETTALHLVTLPSELPAQETIELHQALSKPPGAPLGGLFVNRVPGDRAVSTPLLDELESRARKSNCADIVEDVHILRRRIDESRRASAVVKRLQREIPLPLVRIPDFDADIGPKHLDAIGGTVEKQIA